MGSNNSTFDWPRVRRHWFQFRLRTLLIVTTLLALWLAVQLQRAHRQAAAVAAINAWRHAAGAEYDYRYDASGRPIPNALPVGPVWLTDLLGIDFFHRVIGVWESRNGTPELHPKHDFKDDLRYLRQLPDLRWLILPNLQPSISDADLVNLEHLRQLEVLNLNENKITDEGLQRITRLKKLYSLSLAWTQITDRGLATLVELPELKGLGVAHTAVTDAGLEQIKEMTHLIQLDVRATKVTREGIEQLQAARPNLLIKHD